MRFKRDYFIYLILSEVTDQQFMEAKAFLLRHSTCGRVQPIAFQPASLKNIRHFAWEPGQKMAMENQKRISWNYFLNELLGWNAGRKD